MNAPLTSIKNDRQKRKEGHREEYAKELVEIFQKVSGSKDLLEAFLEDILTPAEHKELEMRWQIVKRLARRDSQRKIARDLGVSIATITRGSRELLDKNGGFQQVLDKLKR